VARSPTPPTHTNTWSAPRRLTNKTSSRCPFSGWNGWVTTTKPKSSLDDAALCRDRRNPKATNLSAFLRDRPLPHRLRSIATVLQPGPDVPQERLHPDALLYMGAGGTIGPRAAGPAISSHSLPGHPQGAQVVDEIEQITKLLVAVIICPLVQVWT
jgi:hypothetical protein